MKSAFGAACAVCFLITTASAQVVVPHRAMPGGSAHVFVGAYSTKTSNGLWRWQMYFPRECVYHVSELNRTFRFVVSLDGSTFRGKHYELRPDASVQADNTWVLPAGDFCVLRDETGTGVSYGTGIMCEPEKWVDSPEGKRHYFKGFVLIDGKVYSPWCEIVAARNSDAGISSEPQPDSYPSLPAPALPEESESVPVPQRRSNPGQYFPPSLPTPALPPAPASTGDEQNTDEEEERIPLRRAPIAKTNRRLMVR